MEDFEEGASSRSLGYSDDSDYDYRWEDEKVYDIDSDSDFVRRAGE